MARELHRTNAFHTLQKRLGRTSRIVGLLFVIVSVAFLLLSFWSPNVVFQVDSVASFLAAMVLLLRDSHSRVETRVLDALMISSDRSIAQLSAHSGKSFTYLPVGKSISDVVVVANTDGNSKGKENELSPSKIVPPGRALAELFARESGLKVFTLDAMKNATEPILTDNFGLAESVRLDLTKGRAVVTLMRPSTRCDGGGEISRGVVGCPVASSLAVLFARASGRPVTLDKCEQDESTGSWKITLEFGKA